MKYSNEYIDNLINNGWFKEVKMLYDDGYISDVLINRYDTIGIINKNLKSLEGIEIFHNLTFLFLKYNYITSLEPIRNLTNLTHINASLNDINSLEPLKYLYKLRKLNLQNNKIESLKPLRGLINLKSLDITFNKLNTIEDLVGIEDLNLNSLVWGDDDVFTTQRKIKCYLRKRKINYVKQL